MKKSKVKDEQPRSDTIFGYYVYRIFGKIIAKLLYPTFITPNQVTTMSAILALIASYFFVIGTQKYLLFGGIVYYASKLLDYTDGQLARLRGTVSHFGIWFDGYTDYHKIIIPIIAIGTGAYLNTGQAKFLILGFVSAILFSSYIVTRMYHMLVLKKHIITLKKDLYSEFQITKHTHLGWTTPVTILIVIFTLINKPDYLLFVLSTVGALPLLIKIHISYRDGKTLDKKLKG